MVVVAKKRKHLLRVCIRPQPQSYPLHPRQIHSMLHLYKARRLHQLRDGLGLIVAVLKQQPALWF